MSRREDHQLEIKLEVRLGREVRRYKWKEYARAYVSFSDIFEVLKDEIEKTLPYLRRW